MGPDGSGFENAGDAKLGKYVITAPGQEECWGSTSALHPGGRETPIKALFSLHLAREAFPESWGNRKRPAPTGAVGSG